MKLKVLENKRAGLNLIMGEVIFIILNVVFFTVVLLFVASAGRGNTFAEQINAKQIALLIDQAKPGTNIAIGLERLYEIAEDNNFKENPVFVNKDSHVVNVKLSRGKGYSFSYFNDAPMKISLNESSKELLIEVLK